MPPLPTPSKKYAREVKCKPPVNTNRKSLVTTPLLTGLHAHQFQLVVINVNDEFPMRSIRRVIRSFRYEYHTLKKLYGTALLLFHTPRDFTTNFNSYSILDSQSEEKNPCTAKPRISDHHVPAYVRVDHKSKFCQ